MKAAFIRSHGGREVLEVGELPNPEVGEKEVLVRIRYAALNHLDVWVRKSPMGLKLRYPHILGGDASGVIETVGAKVTQFKEGEAVIVHPGLSGSEPAPWESLSKDYKILGEHVSGTHAELVKVPVDNVFRKPKDVSFSEAASVPLVFTTAWQMVHHRAAIQPGEWVLIHAGGSGVSSAAIQMAKGLGAHVITTVGSGDKAKLAKELGADFVIDYKRDNFLDVARKITDGKGVEVILDHVGAATWESNIRLLKWGGRMVICGATDGAVAKIDLRHLFYRQLSLLGSTMGSKSDFPELLSRLSRGELKAVVDKVFFLAEVQKAHAYLESRNGFGKVLLNISQ